ncbi:hypothetical protein [Phenylobacterium sp.]|jgi:hypothetical protein|uniref:hypothetical protein n=1 Tax=Phenylobacterium sp. TaxID=1871053 RepID=UPI002F41E794
MSDLSPDFSPAAQSNPEANPQLDSQLDTQAEPHAGVQPAPDPVAGPTVRIVQGHPTGFEPDVNKGGQNGAPKPDGRSAAEVLASAAQTAPSPTDPFASDAMPPGGADAGASLDDPGRGGD